MTVAALIILVQKLSIGLTVFAFGLKLKPLDLTYLLREHRLLIRSLLSMSLVMPLLAVALAASFGLYPAVKIALVALSLSPIPPLLPSRQLKAGGASSYVFSLLVTAAVLAVVLVPVGVNLVELVFGIPADMSPAAIADMMLTDVLAPLATGLLIRRVAPAGAARIVKPISLIAPILLAASITAILITTIPAILSLIGNGTFAAIVAFIIAGLAAGHMLGGPEPDNRTVLALATASRHPGVAIAIAAANAPGQPLVPAAVFLYLITSVVLSMPYLAWRRHLRTAVSD